MSKEILINVESQERRLAIVTDGRLDEYYIERPQDKTIVGNIYKGKIEAVITNIGAAFVDIGLPKKGFLYLSEIESVFESSDLPKADSSQQIKKGQEVLVQVVKESFGTKGPRLSTNIGLAGRYLVLMPQNRQIGISRRIEDEGERRRLREILSSLKITKDVGFIVRTAAKTRSKQELIRDAQFLYKLWSRIDRVSKFKKAPVLIYEEYDLTLRVIRDSFTDDVTKLIVDNKAEYIRIKRFMGSFLRYLIKRLELYRGHALFEYKEIERQIKKIFDSHVYMKSKAYIVIEPTEGLVVIDVNSGGFKKKLSQEETAFKVNCDAAREVARQLVLRDLGGLIVIDFIDLNKESHRREVLNILKQSLSNDRAKYDILGFSKFGLVELTRERIHKTTHMLTYQSCPYCKGRGKIRSPLTTAIFALKELKAYLKNKSLRQVNLTVSPLVIDQILKDNRGLREIERNFKTKVNLIPSPTIHIEEVIIS